MFFRKWGFWLDRVEHTNSMSYTHRVYISVPHPLTHLQLQTRLDSQTLFHVIPLFNCLRYADFR